MRRTNKLPEPPKLKRKLYNSDNLPSEQETDKLVASFKSDALDFFAESEANSTTGFDNFFGATSSSQRLNRKPSKQEKKLNIRALNGKKPFLNLSNDFQSLSDSPEKKDESPYRTKPSYEKLNQQYLVPGNNNVLPSNLDLKNNPDSAFDKFAQSPKPPKSPRTPRTPIKTSFVYKTP